MKDINDTAYENPKAMIHEDIVMFAYTLGYKKFKNFTAVVYNKPKQERYKIFTIPKKTGDPRVIHAPKDERLKKLQQRMSQFLNKGYEKKIENYKSVSHAFRKKHSIETNAYIHKNKQYVFNIDLKDFFSHSAKF